MRRARVTYLLVTSCFLIVTSYLLFLLVTSYQLQFTRLVQQLVASSFSLITSYYFLLVTSCFLLVTRYFLLTTNCFLVVTSYQFTFQKLLVFTSSIIKLFKVVTQGKWTPLIRILETSFNSRKAIFNSRKKYLQSLCSQKNSGLLTKKSQFQDRREITEF